MKKRGLLVITAVMTAAMLTGCCSHDFKSATCEDPQICRECGETQGSARGHEWSKATFVEPATCIHCGETVGEKLRPSKVGFYNFEEMGNGLVGIHDYVVNSQGDSYVIVGDYVKKTTETVYTYKKVFQVEDGYLFQSRISPKYKRCELVSNGTPSLYTIVNNDNLLCNNDRDSFTIIDRETSNVRDDVIVFKIRRDGYTRGTGLYVPYSLIDWDRGTDRIKKEDGSSVHILYFVPA